MGTRLRRVADRLEPAVKSAVSGLAWVASEIWDFLWWCVGWFWRFVRLAAQLVGPLAAVLAVVGVLIVGWSVERLSSGGEPVEQEWPSGGPPRLRLLLTADADVDDDSVGVDVRYAVDEDRLSIGITACHRHDRIAVVFARADPTVVERAETSWRLSTTAEEEATWDPAGPTSLEDAASVVVIEAPEGGVDDAEAEDTCMLYGLAVAGFGLSSSRGGQTLIETPQVKTCGGTLGVDATVASDSTIELDGVEGRWRRECTDDRDTHRVRIEAKRGLRVVWSSHEQVDRRQPLDFADEAKVLLADVAELNRVRTRDIRLGVVAGVGAAFVAEALILVVRRGIKAWRGRSISAAAEVDR